MKLSLYSASGNHIVSGISNPAMDYLKRKNRTKSILKKFYLICLLAFATNHLSGQNLTTPDSAKYFDGKTMVVCGKVFGTFVSKSGMTFLNFGNPYPDHTFSAVISKKDSTVLQGVSHSFYKGRNVCVKGRIKMYKDKPELFIESPGNLWVDESGQGK